MEDIVHFPEFESCKILFHCKYFDFSMCRWEYTLLSNFILLIYILRIVDFSTFPAVVRVVNIFSVAVYFNVVLAQKCALCFGLF
jgi:hypothetical protein